MIDPHDFAIRCKLIVSTMRGHAAHSALDILTNDVLRQLGYGEGIDIFERKVAHWHRQHHPYPHQPCPDCEHQDKT